MTDTNDANYVNSLTPEEQLVQDNLQKGVVITASSAENANNEELGSLENKPNSNNNTEDTKGQWGGFRPNGGRPVGSKNKATLERKLLDDAIKQRVLRGHKKLLDSQFTLAHGCSYLYMIETKYFGKKAVKQKPVLITDPDTIEAYLNGDLDGEPDEYYYITTERPDNKAIDSLIDRVTGKARQNIGLDGGEDGKPIKQDITGMKISKDDDKIDKPVETKEEVKSTNGDTIQDQKQ